MDAHTQIHKAHDAKALAAAKTQEMTTSSHRARIFTTEPWPGSVDMGVLGFRV